MSSSDRSDGSSGRRDEAARAKDEPDAPVERSSRGRIIIHSSSHPPSRGAASDAERAPISGPAPALERATRTKRDTPAERPRRRRQVQAGGPADAPAQQSRELDTAPRATSHGRVLIASGALALAIAALSLWWWLAP